MYRRGSKAAVLWGICRTYRWANLLERHRLLAGKPAIPAHVELEVRGDLDGRVDGDPERPQSPPQRRLEAHRSDRVRLTGEQRKLDVVQT